MNEQDDPQSSAPRIIVDSDWKQEAAKEKDRLARETEQASRASDLPPASILELANMLAMQAVIGFGGLRTPEGQTLPRDLPTAKHFIDLLEVLQQKTKGNLADEERRALDSVLHEMRLRYVEAITAPARPPQTKPIPR